MLYVYVCSAAFVPVAGDRPVPGLRDYPASSTLEGTQGFPRNGGRK